VRELFRIKKDREEREAKIREKMDIERRRKMTDAERAAEDAYVVDFRHENPPHPSSCANLSRVVLHRQGLGGAPGSEC
jgi:hypothetical protein